MSEQKETNAFIKNVHLKGYKSVKDLSVRLNNGLNIIIGPNGSGKTNFVDFLSELLNLDNQRDNAYSAIIELQAADENIIFDEKFEGKYEYFQKINKKYPIVVSNIKNSISEQKESVDVKLASLLLRKKQNFISLINPIKISFSIPASFEKYMLNELGFISLDNFDVSSSISSILHILPAVFEKNIEANLSSMIDENNIFQLNKTTIKEYLELNSVLISNLKKYTPINNLKLSDSLFIVDSETIPRVQVNYIMLEFFVNGEWRQWKELSDGTKRLFYIIYQITNSYDLVFIEEPENGVHPDQLRLLLDFIVEQSKTKQIILTTHAPEVLNILYEDELDRIIVTRFDEETGTQMHHLSEKQKKKGQSYMKNVGFLSMFWSNSSLEKYVPEEHE